MARKGVAKSGYQKCVEYHTKLLNKGGARAGLKIVPLMNRFCYRVIKVGYSRFRTIRNLVGEGVYRFGD